MPDAQWDSLAEIAEGIQQDVRDTYPDMNTEYDQYIEQGVYPEAGHQVWGLIDMGDAGIWCYQWVEEDRYDKTDWVDVSGAFDPHDVKLRIIAMRQREQTRPD